MSRLIALSQNLFQFVPTADHDYVPALNESEQVQVLKELFDHYSGATKEEKSAIENAFSKLLEIQPDLYINEELLQLIIDFNLQLPFIKKIVHRLQGQSKFVKKLKNNCF
ncbi:MAG: hypothetical protein Fur0041_20350 [Bacteroidia bacterium]